MNDINDSLKTLQNENIIWYIYFIIIIFALVANKFEEDYLFTKNKTLKLYGRNINLTLLIVAFFIYLYFVSEAINNLEKAKLSGNNKKIKVAMERLITTTTFFVAGALAIYTEIDDNVSNVDIAII